MEKQSELVMVDIKSSREDEIIEMAKNADVIIANSPQVTRRVAEGLPKCKVIIRSGHMKEDSIDVLACTDNNIIVCQIPDYWVEEVATHAIALLLACAKKLALLNEGVKQGRWGEVRQAMGPMSSIYGQTLGIMGCGKIGRAVASKAQCFGLDVLGCDPYADESLCVECGIDLISLPELLRESDYISVHVLYTDETRHLIGEKEFQQMKPTAYFINTAQGVLIDEPALIKALQEKRLAGAGLDVFEKEPVGQDNPLLEMDNVVVTPHTASHSAVVGERVRAAVQQEVARIASGRWPKNVVNRAVKPKVDLVKED